jgi:hypothetical protein
MQSILVMYSGETFRTCGFNSVGDRFQFQTNVGKVVIAMIVSYVCNLRIMTRSCTNSETIIKSYYLPHNIVPTDMFHMFMRDPIIGERMSDRLDIHSFRRHVRYDVSCSVSTPD